jgi:hypothetical protein
MKWNLGQATIDRLRGKRTSATTISKPYKKIYLPIYNSNHKLNPEEPHIFNEEGQKMRAFFLRDAQWAHHPSYMQSKHFIWDRYNIGLNTHFYTHNAMLQTAGAPSQRYGILWESEALVPNDYKLFKRHKGLEKDFDLIFTFSEDILEAVPNARFYPGCASSWYGNKIGGGRLSNTTHVGKTKGTSILSSAKFQTPFHKIRLELARKLKGNDLVDVYGTFDGGPQVQLCDTLADYRFSFAIENDLKPLFFTERLTSCFAAMTIPVYLGASKIDQFFNPDGIIFLKTTDLDDIDKVLQKCTEQEYERRLPAVLDNYQRVQPYLNANDWLYETYLRKKVDSW